MMVGELAENLPRTSSLTCFASAKEGMSGDMAEVGGSAGRAVEGMMSWEGNSYSCSQYAPSLLHIILGADVRIPYLAIAGDLRSVLLPEHSVRTPRTVRGTVLQTRIACCSQATGSVN